MSGQSLPTLKCVVAWSARRHLCDIVGQALTAAAGEGEVRRIGEESYLVHTSEEPAALRDRVRSALTDGEGVIVVEFEKWSAYGADLDSTWLLRRGH